MSKQRIASIKTEREGSYCVVNGSGEVVAENIGHRNEAQKLAAFADEVTALLAQSTFGAQGWRLRDTELLRILQISPCGTFVLVERLGRSNAEWVSVGLFTTTVEGLKAAWAFGWNGIRLSHTDSSEHLRRRHPSIFEFVLSTLLGIDTAEDAALRACHRDSLRRALDHASAERRQRLTELAALEAEIQHTEARLREYDAENAQTAQRDGDDAVSLDVTRH